MKEYFAIPPSEKVFLQRGVSLAALIQLLDFFLIAH